MQKKFVVIDGSSLLYRAFYALPLLTTANGQYTNAIYGFATMLVKLLGELQPDTLAIAFDKGKKTFRNTLYTEYKGTRKPTPTELSSQIPMIHELAEVFGIQLIEADNYEADDIIGTLATKAAAAGDQAYIITGDRDALQLIGENITVMLTKKGISDMQVFDAAAFQDKYGILPQALIDLKGLMGDSSDNIPGVPGVGEKTATKLLLEYGTLENVLAHADEVPGKKLQERLLDNKEQAVLSKQLATIIRDMDLAYASDLYKIAPDVDRLKSFCRRYEFRSVLARIDALFPQNDGFGFGTVVEALAPEFQQIVNLKQLETLVEGIREEKALYFYPIFAGRVPQMRMESMAIWQGDAIFFIKSSLVGWEILLALFADPSIQKISHGIKPLYHAGLAPKGALFDTMLAAYLLDPAVNTYDLTALMERHLQMYGQPAEFDEAAAAAAWAVSCIHDLHACLAKKLAENELLTLYREIELPLLAVLAGMEAAGIRVNRTEIERMSKEIALRLEEVLQNIYDMAGAQFNVNSTKQLGEVLFDRLALPAAKKTKRGYSTDAEVLEKLLPEHPIIAEILEYRTLTKLKSTYLDGLVPLIDLETGRIHTSFNQMVTATGRLSSSEPNLQNIPVRTEAGRKIRELFVPGEAYQYLLSADYSQIELRILAHMSKDKNFVEAFTHGQDIHTRTASEVFGVPMAEVTDELRGRAKAVNFGIVYGISDYGLARDLNISRKEAGEYIENYFEKCQGVKSFIDSVVENAYKNGYVTTLFGRRRYLPDIRSTNYNQRTLAERMAMNTPIQGTAADVIKKAMITVDRALKERQMKSRILLQVHDELVLETVEEEIEKVAEILREAMENVIELSVPLTIDINVGENWAKAK